MGVRKDNSAISFDILNINFNFDLIHLGIHQLLQNKKCHAILVVSSCYYGHTDRQTVEWTVEKYIFC